MDEKLAYEKQIAETKAKTEKGLAMVELMKWKKTTL